MLREICDIFRFAPSISPLSSKNDLKKGTLYTLMYIHFNVHSLSVDSLYKRMWHDKKPQSKNFLWLHTVILNYFIYSRIMTSYILYGGTIPVKPCKNWVKASSSHLMRKTFPLSRCLPPTHKTNHAYLTDSQYSPWLLKKYARHTSRDYCKTSGFFFLLIFLVSSPLSLTTMRFNIPHQWTQA